MKPRYTFEEIRLATLGMIRQYMPQQFIKVRGGSLPNTARELAKDKVTEIAEDYNYATKSNYMTASALVK